ncbi:hypothetical protein V8C37DRAFT_391049 [Trichoderma ceciliae]
MPYYLLIFPLHFLPSLPHFLALLFLLPKGMKTYPHFPRFRYSVVRSDLTCPSADTNGKKPFPVSCATLTATNSITT